MHVHPDGIISQGVLSKSGNQPLFASPTNGTDSNPKTEEGLPLKPLEFPQLPVIYTKLRYPTRYPCFRGEAFAGEFFEQVCTPTTTTTTTNMSPAMRESESAGSQDGPKKQLILNAFVEMCA